MLWKLKNPSPCHSIPPPVTVPPLLWLKVYLPVILLWVSNKFHIYPDSVDCQFIVRFYRYLRRARMYNFWYETLSLLNIGFSLFLYPVVNKLVQHKKSIAFIVFQLYSRIAPSVISLTPPFPVSFPPPHNPIMQINIPNLVSNTECFASYWKLVVGHFGISTILLSGYSPQTFISRSKSFKSMLDTYPSRSSNVMRACDVTIWLCGNHMIVKSLFKMEHESPLFDFSTIFGANTVNGIS